MAGKTKHKQAPSKPTKGRGGPPKGSANALRHGRTMARRRLTVGELPKQMVAIKREGLAYRRELEAEVEAEKGAISFTDAHHIDTASAATVQAGINRWILRHRMDQLTTADIRGCTADIVKAKEKRDAAVKALALDAPPQPPWLEAEVINGQA